MVILCSQQYMIKIIDTLNKIGINFEEKKNLIIFHVEFDENKYETEQIMLLKKAL